MSDIYQTIIDKVAKNIPLTEIYDGLNGAAEKINFYKTVFALIEAGRIPNIMVCWCGIDCTRCRTFRATINNDDDERKIVQKYYEEIGHSSSQPET